MLLHSFSDQLLRNRKTGGLVFFWECQMTQSWVINHLPLWTLKHKQELLQVLSLSTNCFPCVLQTNLQFASNTNASKFCKSPLLHRCTSTTKSLFKHSSLKSYLPILNTWRPSTLITQVVLFHTQWTRTKRYLTWVRTLCLYILSKINSISLSQACALKRVQHLFLWWKKGILSLCQVRKWFHTILWFRNLVAIFHFVRLILLLRQLRREVQFKLIRFVLLFQLIFQDF